MEAKIVAITGGIAAGKSQVVKFFADLDYPVLDADQIARELMKSSGAAFPKVIELFGNEILDSANEVDRKKLRKIVFSNSDLKSKLEAITHPLIQQESKLRANKLCSADNKIVIYEAPVLFEAKRENDMHAVICVTADEETRIKRIIARDNCSREEALKIISQQMSQEEKAKRSNYIIENNGDLTDLKKSVVDISNQLRSTQY